MPIAGSEKVLFIKTALHFCFRFLSAIDGAGSKELSEQSKILQRLPSQHILDQKVLQKRLQATPLPKRREKHGKDQKTFSCSEFHADNLVDEFSFSP